MPKKEAVNHIPIPASSFFIQLYPQAALSPLNSVFCRGSSLCFRLSLFRLGFLCPVLLLLLLQFLRASPDRGE